MIYGYCRISKKEQNINRQIRNILSEYPTAIIFQESFTGTKINRPVFNNLLCKLKTGDIIIFDSVSRMARNADEGISLYFKLFDQGIHLRFLKEKYINTEIYSDNLQDKVELTGTDEDELFIGINNYFKKLAKKQIIIAFEQAQKEVDDLRQRTKEGLETARLAGKQIGQRKGIKLNVKKATPAKEKIKKYSKSFSGSLNDADVIKLIGISRNTFYKYKKELLNK